jgi:hypothetical protein
MVQLDRNGKEGVSICTNLLCTLKWMSELQVAAATWLARANKEQSKARCDPNPTFTSSFGALMSRSGHLKKAEAALNRHLKVELVRIACVKSECIANSPRQRSSSICNVTVFGNSELYEDQIIVMWQTVQSNVPPHCSTCYFGKSEGYQKFPLSLRLKCSLCWESRGGLGFHACVEYLE